MVRWHNAFQAQACSNGDPHVWSMTLVQNSVWVDIFSPLFSRPVPNPPVAHICLQISAFKTSQQGDDNEPIQGNWILAMPFEAAQSFDRTLAAIFMTCRPLKAAFVSKDWAQSPRTTAI